MASVRQAMSAVVVLSVLLVGLVTVQERAQAADCGEAREVSVSTLTEASHRQLTRIYQDIDAGEFAIAFSALETMLERGRFNQYEQAVVYRVMGHVRLQQGRSVEALEHFQQAVDLNRLPDSQHFDLILTIAHLQYKMAFYPDALAQIEKWFCLAQPEQADAEEVWVMKAGILAELEQHRDALSAIDRAIAMSGSPARQWYEFKLGLHIELGEHVQAIDVLKILIPMDPDNKRFWTQMSALHAELGNDAESLAALKLAHRRDLLDRQTELLQLASLLQLQGSPRRAAEVLEDGLGRGIVEQSSQNWAMVAGSWYQARELDKALKAFGEAADKSSDGKLDLQRGFLLVDQKRWGEAIDALTRARERGGLDNDEIGNALLLLGIVHYNLGHIDVSLDTFNEAKNYRRVSAAAREWSNHVGEARGRHSGP